MDRFSSRRYCTVVVFVLAMLIGSPFEARAELAGSEAVGPESDPISLDLHLDNLDRVRAQRVAAAVAGVEGPRSWQDLRRHYLRLSADLEADHPDALRLQRALRELNELEALVEDPQALKALYRRLKNPVAVGGEPDLAEKIANGTATGRVIRSSDGLPLASAEVAYSNADFFDVVFTDENGFYEISVPAGTFTVSASALHYQQEVYDDIPCDFGCFFPNGDLVEVAAGQTVANIDFALDILGRVTGQVVAQSSGIPLAGIGVEAWSVGGLFSESFAETSADGTYVLEGLAAGEYWIVATGEAYQTEAFDGVPCSSTAFGLECSESPQNVSVDVGITVEDVDFSLERRGSISGRITDALSGEGIPLVRVVFEPTHGNGYGSEAFTDSEGRYQSPGLNAGEYWAYTDNFDFYVNEVYHNVRCPLRQFTSGCILELGRPIQVSVDSTVHNIDFDLDPGGTLSGTVTRALTETPVEFAEIRVTDWNQVDVATVFTEPDGTYELKGLSAGAYRLEAFGSDYVPELFDDIPCPSSVCPLEEGDFVAVNVGATSGGIDFELDRLGILEGRVVSLETGEPIGLALVHVYEAETGFVADLTQADGQGVFQSRRLQAGSYRLFAEDITGRHLSGLYPDIPCSQGDCDFSQGGTVDVELNSSVTGLKISLKTGATILGSIFDRVTGLAGEQAEVTAYDTSGTFIATGFVGQDGEYVVPGLTSGQYYLMASGYFFGHQVYGGETCSYVETCDPLSGTPISVVEGGEAPNIDFEVDFVECRFVSSELCLRNDRFRAAVKWRDGSGNEGYGSFFWLSNDSGFFWFFNFDNIEGVVKVLDACSQPVDRFWVFAAGLTDLDVTLWITDLASGQTRTYTNAAGQAFQPIQDTNAFATCAGTTGLGLVSDAVGSDTFVSEAAASGSEGPTQGQALAGTPISAAAKACDFASGRLCLNGGRFAVEAFYQTPGQPEQLAGARLLTDDSGTFYFFSPDNIEVLVKVLDACSVFDRFWVFGAGLTNVRVRLVVTDTETGEVREYVNNQGNAFEPVQDTQAFSTCF